MMARLIEHTSRFAQATLQSLQYRLALMFFERNGKLRGVA
jgi:hypothetical protein